MVLEKLEVVDVSLVVTELKLVVLDEVVSVTDVVDDVSVVNEVNVDEDMLEAVVVLEKLEVVDV